MVCCNMSIIEVLYFLIKKSSKPIKRRATLQPVMRKRLLSLAIGAFHMTSLKFKLQNYWSPWDFTFMMYKGKWKLIFIVNTFSLRMGSWFFDRLRLNSSCIRKSTILMSSEDKFTLLKKNSETDCAPVWCLHTNLYKSESDKKFLPLSCLRKIAVTRILPSFFSQILDIIYWTASVLFWTTMTLKNSNTIISVYIN